MTSLNNAFQLFLLHFEEYMVLLPLPLDKEELDSPFFTSLETLLHIFEHDIYTYDDYLTHKEEINTRIFDAVIPDTHYKRITEYHNLVTSMQKLNNFLT